MIESLDPGQLQEMALRTREVDRQYADLRQQYNQLKHLYDTLLLQQDHDAHQHQQADSLSRKLREELAEKEAENRALRVLGDQHLIALSGLQAELADFYSQLPKHLPRSLSELAAELAGQSEPCNEMRIQQERIRLRSALSVRSMGSDDDYLSEQCLSHECQ